MRIGVLTSGGDAPGMNAAIRAAVRQADALARQADYNALTTAQKLADLDRGGFAAKKQRAKLTAPAKKVVEAPKEAVQAGKPARNDKKAQKAQVRKTAQKEA